MKRRSPILFLALIAVTLLVTALLVLIGLGYLALPAGAAPTPVTVLGAERWIDQGSSTNGEPWFGESYFNYTVPDGYPISVAPGGTFQMVVAFSNFDNQTHQIYSATASPPCSVVRSEPALPSIIAPSEDSPVFEFTIQVPDQPGAQVWVNLTLDALA